MHLARLSISLPMAYAVAIALSPMAHAQPAPAGPPAVGVIEATTRPITMTAKTGAAAVSRLPAMNRPISSISIRLRAILVPSTVMSGAPTTTPSA